MNIYKKLFKELTNAKINYIIVGGVAVNMHGFRRFTGDIDIIILVNKANLKKLETLCKKIGYSPKQPISIQSLLNEKNLKKLIIEKNFLAFTLISDNNNNKFDLDIDILTNESLNFQKFIKNADYIKIWDITLPVIGIDDLIEMKKNAGRSKDLEDVKALLQLKSNEYED